MKTSRSVVAANRGRILTEAARLFRERGYDGVSVAEIMQAAGLTQGAFYSYFTSKDELAAQATRVALMPLPENLDLAEYLKFYLGREHRDNPGAGCGVAALASDAARQCDEVKAEMTTALKRTLQRIGDTRSGRASARRDEAIVTWAAMVGAVVLSRAIDDPALSDEVLSATRRRLTAALG